MSYEARGCTPKPLWRPAEGTGVREDSQKNCFLRGGLRIKRNH